MNKTLVLGKNGFIAKSLGSYVSKKKDINFKFISKKEINLLNPKNCKSINKYIKKYNKLIFISAKAPAKNFNDIQDNLKMLVNLIKYADINLIKHFTYISSDAVYSDTKKKITEISETNPKTHHGIMHLLREGIVKNYLNKKKICILRPTLIYGKGDTHSGYGPNLFLNLIKQNKKIKVFGNGAEKRDHIHIFDVVDTIYRANEKEINGIYNVSSGHVISFLEIAKKLIKFIQKFRVNFDKKKKSHASFRI